MLRQHLPKYTNLEIEWEEFLLPAPCFGVTLWGAYASLVWLRWSGSKGDGEVKNTVKKRGDDVRDKKVDDDDDNVRAK